MTDFEKAAQRVSNGGDPRAEAQGLVADMTLDEKLGCLDGDEPFWPGLIEMMSGGYYSRTWPAARVDRLGIPGLQFADGPRGCVVGPATTFPVSMARGATFDPELERRVGLAIGDELRDAGANFTGAVCMNLLRHPAWGRAQETYGEDPHHVGRMAAACTDGLQHHVMACMKHFALNSMENARFTVDVTVDERSLHEVYLRHFEHVAKSGVAAVMSAYNSVNGHWCGENSELLTTILRDEWGWDGLVITDFMVGLRDPISSISAGCNIEMPFAQQRANTVDTAVADGELKIEDVEQRVIETVATFLRFAHVFAPRPKAIGSSSSRHRDLAREVAREATVLLSNDGTLPLDPGSISRMAVLGRLAAVPSLGDGGSSNVLHTKDPVTPLNGIRAALPRAEIVHSDDDVTIVEGADAVVVVVGYTAADEGEYMGPGLIETLAGLSPPLDHPQLGTDDPKLLEQLESAIANGGMTGTADFDGGDRDSLRLSPEDEALIAAACTAHDRVVVAIIAGSAVVMPWLEQPCATVMSWYAGSEAGSAFADVLLGAEPGGRLPFAIPTDEDQLIDFDKNATECTYGLLHGQWWLDAQGVEAHLPFGHGLSYTSFAFDVVSIDATAANIVVENTGQRPGSTVVFAFGSVPESAHRRPPRRLIGFRKVRLGAGEDQRVEIPLDLAQLDLRLEGSWVTEDAPIVVSVGFDARSATQADQVRFP